MLLVQSKLCGHPVDMLDSLLAINALLKCDDPKSCAFPEFQGEVDLNNGRVVDNPDLLTTCLQATDNFKTNCPGGGVSISDLVKIAERNGLVAAYNQVSVASSASNQDRLAWLKEMLDQQMPVIVHVDYKLGLDPDYPVGQAGHYMVLVGVDGTDDNSTVYVVDPGVTYPSNGDYSNGATTSESPNTPVPYTVKQFLQSWGAARDPYGALVLSAKSPGCSSNPAPLGIVANSIDSLAAGQVAVPYSASVVAQFGAGLYTWSVVPNQGNLPPGIQLDSGSGIFSGTPSSPGLFTFTLQVTDDEQNVASGVATITIGSATGTLTITSPGDLQSATAGRSYSFPLSASGGTSPYHWSASGVTCPTSISGLDGVCVSDPGTVQGTPTTSTSSGVSFSLQVVDSSASPQTVSKEVTLTVLPTNLPPQVYSVTAMPATVSAQGTSTLTCTAVDPQQYPLTYAWSFTGGNPPQGNSASIIWTAPSAPGAYTATCTVTSNVGLSGSGSTVLQVSNAPLSNSISPTSGIAGVTQFTVSGSGATPNQGVTATITMPNASTTTSHTTANSNGQYSFGPFTETATGVYSEVDSDDHTGGKSYALAWTVNADAGVPSVSGILPNPVPGSYSAQPLIINGSNFANGATLTYVDSNGKSYPGHSTTFVNSSQIIDPAFNDASDAGTWTVTVVNPGGQSSSPFSFTVSASAPSVSSVSPNPVPGSNSGQQLTINGSNFVSGATLTYVDTNGNFYPGHSTTFVNSSQIVDPAFNDASDAGTWTVTVVNPGGQSSSPFSFTVSASAPSVSSVSPNPVPGSNSGQQLTINGSNFVSGATVTYHDPQGNSYPGHSTTFVNSSQIVDPAFNDASDAGTWTVTVVNPGGQSSTPFNFTVSASTPSVSSVSPNPVPGSNSGQQLTINGSNFVSGATVTYHDPQGNSYPGHSTTFVNSSQIVDPAFNDASDAGTWTVTVVNPGGQSSTPFNFTVSASTPSVSSVSPNPVPGSNSGQQLTINGSNFVSGATVTYHDPQGNSYPGHSTTFVNSSQIVDPAFNDASDAGTWTVTVVNPGGQSSTPFNFTVSASTPSVSSVSPNPVPGSNSGQQLTINGSNFVSGATVTYHDPQGNSYPGHSTTFVNSSQIVDPAFNDASDAGTWTVTVVNPGGQSSTPFNFTVSASTPSVSSVSPNPVPGSNSGQQLTINGSNFVSGATVTYHDPQGNSYPGHSTTFVNSSQIVDPAFNDASDAGTWTVTVVNPGGQSSTPFNFTVSASTPSVSSVSPNPVPGSNSGQQLTINGSNFVSGATVTYHDPQGNSYPGHSTTFVNSSQIVDPAFNDASDAGTWTVTVVNPGGQSSTPFNFTVSASTPSVSSVSPNPVPGSNSGQQLTINGSNFVSGATVTYHDPQGNSYPGHSTTFVNSSQIVDPAFNDASDAGTWTVTVVNPGGQSSTPFNFTVSASTPSVSSVSPNPVPGSNSGQQLTINGSNFVSGATVTYHDPQGNSYPGHSTTFVNSSQIVDPAFNDASDAGTWTVTVVNPGGQSSSPFSFTVQ